VYGEAAAVPAAGDPLPAEPPAALEPLEEVDEPPPPGVSFELVSLLEGTATAPVPQPTTASKNAGKHGRSAALSVLIEFEWMAKADLFTSSFENMRCDSASVNENEVIFFNDFVPL
jgi:hypothetical protein